MGLLQAEMSKEMSGSVSFSPSTVSNLIGEFGFEWSSDFSVFETLLEIAPAIKSAEMIAGQLARNIDPRADEIYRLLDQIMAKTKDIVSAVSREAGSKDEIFIAALRAIKDNLASIAIISSQKLSDNE